MYGGAAMISFLISPLARWVGAAVLTLVILSGIYVKGRFDERKIFNQYKAEVKALADAQAENTAKKDKKNAKLISETKNAYNNQLSNLRNYYGLRYPKSSSTVPSVSSAAGGAYDYSPDNLPPAAVLASQCAEETLKLLKLQEFNANVAENME